MTTCREIVTAACRKIGIVAHDEAMDADMASNGMAALNYMLSAWELDGIALEHIDLALTDTFPLANKFREGVIYCLAARIAPAYTVPAGFDADDFFRKVQAAYTSAPDVEMPAMLRRRSEWTL